MSGPTARCTVRRHELPWYQQSLVTTLCVHCLRTAHVADMRTPTKLSSIPTDAAIIIQARMGSTRFPRKMLEELEGLPLAEYVYRRCAQSTIRPIIVATSTDPSDDPLAACCEERHIPVFRGSLSDVLSRYITAAESIDARYVVRVCGDSPFVDPHLIDAGLERLQRERLDYVGYDRVPVTSPFSSEAMTLEALRRARALTTAPDDVEHVTRFIIHHPEQFSAAFPITDWSEESLRGTRLTIDYPEDIERARAIISTFGARDTFTTEEIVRVVRERIASVAA